MFYDRIETEENPSQAPTGNEPAQPGEPDGNKS